MPTENNVIRQRIYLLTIWCEQGKPQEMIRLSIENPHTGARYGFSKADVFIRFLEKCCREDEISD